MFTPIFTTDNANVVEIRDLLLCKRTVSSSFLSQSPPRQVTDVYIVTELMQSDLGRVLDHHNSTLTTEQVRALMFQFVLGLYLNLSLLKLSAALLTKPLSGARIDVPVRARPPTKPLSIKALCCVAN